jgi:hypothetical protein
MSRGFYGNVQVGATIPIIWATNDANGASITRGTDGTISVYKDTSAVQVTTGITDTEDFDGLTGIHLVEIDTSSDSDFYSLGSMFHVVLSGAVIDSQTVNHPIASFAIGELIGVTSTASDNADNIAIANRALAFLGEEPITSFSDSDKRSVTADLLFNPARDSTLELHTWKSARKLATLVQDTTYTGTAGSVTAGTATLTIGSNTIAVGNTITVNDWVPTGYNGSFAVTAVTSTTVSYLLTDPGAATTFGTVIDPVEPVWAFNRQYALPSDFLRHVRNQNQGLSYEIHGDKLITDQSSVNMEYVFKLTTVSDMNPMLKEAFAAKLALDMSFRLDTSGRKQQLMEKLFDRAIALAKNIDASQRRDDRIESSEWTDARLVDSSRFRVLGEVPTQ